MMDIVVPCFGEEGEAVGFRCESDEEYAHAMNVVLSMEQSHRLQMAAAARRCISSDTICCELLVMLDVQSLSVLSA